MSNKSKGIVSWPEEERPRERLLSRGAEALTDAELIAILIRVGFKGTSAVELARQMLTRFGSLRAMAIADGKPERRFIRFLCDRENTLTIDGWLKNSPQRFYAIEYAWKKGNTPKRGEFSPDFFIKKGTMILVVEIKDDSEIDDPSQENQKKFEYSRDHFGRLNDWLRNELG